MECLPDSLELSKCVVRLDAESPLGAGFFVAPDWILTAAHVVASATDTTLSARWNGSDLRVKVKELWPPERGETAIWQCPDLALVELLDKDIQHPIARLSRAIPQVNEIC